MRLTQPQFRMVISAINVKQAAESKGLSVTDHTEQQTPGDPLNFYRSAGAIRGLLLAHEWLRPHRPVGDEDDPRVILYDQLEQLLMATELVMAAPMDPHDREYLHRELAHTRQALYDFVTTLKGLP